MLASRATTTVSPVFAQTASWEPARLGGGELLATVAHELRGPLAAILYALQVVTDRGDGTSDGGFKYSPTNGGLADTDVTAWRRTAQRTAAR